MQNTLNFSPFKSPEPEPNPAFNVVIAYEDFETGKHAKKTYDFLVENLGGESVFSSQMWKFDVLAVPKLREMAAKDAAGAEIIIVSMHGKSELPPEVKSWIDMWLKERTHAIALVALFDSDADERTSAREYLSEIAKLAGIEFFSQPGLWPREDEPAAVPENRSRRNTRTFSLLAGMVQQDHDVSHWGINE